jgi:hypothetical protein
VTPRTAALPAVLIAVVAMVLVLSPVPAAQAASTTLFRLRDARLDELSGIARGVASPGVFWAQNDSGDSARIFALDASTGRVRGVYAVPDAENHDWEDLAVATDATGRPSVWIADIGDNDATRHEVQLYRVPEPHVGGTGGRSASTRMPDVWRLRYPSGPVNAESLAVTPGGRAYVITKSADGRSFVFVVPPRPDPDRVQTMRLVATIRLAGHGGLVPASLQVSATGAAMSRDGRWLAVRTYTDAYVWRVSGGDVAAAVRAAPARVRLPLQPQGEGVCFDGAALVLDSEQVGSTVYRMPLAPAPPAPADRTSPRPAASPRPSASPRPAASPRPSASSGPPTALLAVGVVVVVVVVGVSGAAVAVRTRRRRG